MYDLEMRTWCEAGTFIVVDFLLPVIAIWSDPWGRANQKESDLSFLL